MRKVTIADVVKKDCVDKAGRTYTDYAVVLFNETGKRALPIWVGPAEGYSIAMGLTDFQFIRPMTFYFFANLLSAINVKIDQVRIESLKGNTFYAVVRVSCGKIMKEIDARPSDALALAVRTGSPIFASEDVLQAAGIDIGKKVTSEAGGAKDIIKEFENILSQRRAVGLKLSKQEVENRNKELVKAVFGT